MEDKNISEQESLRIIHQMINTAKQEQKDNGEGWIVWGWMLFLASVCTYLNIKFNWFSTFYFWNLFGLLSLLLLAWQTIRQFILKRAVRVKTYTNDLFEKLNIGFFISLLLIIVSMNLGVNPLKGFALLLGLYGFWILIYGTVLNFKPSLWGAYIVWGFAFGSLFVPSFEWTMILHAAAVLIGYIIPGYIAKKEFNTINQEAKNSSV